MHNKDTGFLGESIARDLLIQKGFEIITCNWRHAHLEIDIIASKGKVLHIIEVKTRNSIAYGYPEQQVSKRKMQFLKNAAAIYQYQNPFWKYLQFDIIALSKNENNDWDILFNEDVFF